jgi:hypothetical protein
VSEITITRWTVEVDGSITRPDPVEARHLARAAELAAEVAQEAARAREATSPAAHVERADELVSALFRLYERTALGRIQVIFAGAFDVLEALELGR